MGPTIGHDEDVRLTLHGKCKVGVIHDSPPIGGCSNREHRDFPARRGLTFGEILRVMVYLRGNKARHGNDFDLLRKKLSGKFTRHAVFHDEREYPCFRKLIGRAKPR